MLKIILASGCKIMDLNESKVYQISGCLKLANVVNEKEVKGKSCCYYCHLLL